MGELGNLDPSASVVHSNLHFPALLSMVSPGRDYLEYEQPRKFPKQ